MRLKPTIEMTRCDFCGKKIEGMPFNCWRCGGSFCGDHRLPENHACIGVYHWTQVPKPTITEIIPENKAVPTQPKHIQTPSNSPQPRQKHDIKDDVPRLNLCEILKTYGITIIEDPKRLKAFLNDLCKGKYSREINAIVSSLDENIPHEILKSKDNIPYDLLSTQLKNRLLKNTYHTEELILWTIESWAMALDFPNFPRDSRLVK